MYKKVKFTYEEIIEMLKELNVIVVSYDKMGSYYHDYEERWREYADEATKFTDNNRICNRISKIRYIISSRFNETYNDKTIEKSYEVFDKLKYWENPGDDLLPFEDIDDDS